MKTNIERAADGILISAGAGMSIDSGLPDFRGGHGLARRVYENIR